MRLTHRKQINFLELINSCFHREVCKAASCQYCFVLKDVLSSVREVSNAMGLFWLELLDNELQLKLYSCNCRLNFYVPEMAKNFKKLAYDLLNHVADKSTALPLSGKLQIKLNDAIQVYYILMPLKLDNNFILFVYKNEKQMRNALGTIKECVSKVNDILRWKKMNVEFSKSNRLLLTGVMTGAMAHDLNNIISGVLSSLEIMNYDGVKDKRLKEIKKGLKKGANIVNNLLSFVRRKEQSSTSAVVDLNRIVCELIPLLRLLVNKKCSLHVEFSPVPLLIKAFTSKIEQILVNLISNAKDALVNVAKAEIFIKLSKIPNGKKAVPSLTPEPYAVISVKDNGCGISKVNQKKIFEPFFTTKKEGKGIGLGLFIVKSLVGECDGEITFESKEGCGTTFYCYFPLVNKNPYSTMA